MFYIPKYILILFLTIIVDYFAGILIERSNGKRKKAYLIFSIIVTCLILFIFKYFNFFQSNITNLAELFNLNYPLPILKVILPIGLSFHTFQSLSYVIEVYRGKQKAETNFGIYSLYVMFFPQLVAGPIERPQNLLPQFHTKHDFKNNQVTSGLRLMLWGFFKKLVVADRLAIFVNEVYNSPDEYKGFSVIIATVFFSFQIYCDFSGYSDIAIGSARVLGFDLMKNFDRPYFSKSISEFWRRWHISLSTWFKDYIYVPLGGNKNGKKKWAISVFVTFLVSGIWHGANWTFFIWGLIHAFLMLLSGISKTTQEKFWLGLNVSKESLLYKIINISLTFSMVSFAWIFFRANSLNDAYTIIKNIFTFSDYSHSLHWLSSELKGEFILGLLFICLLETIQFLQRKEDLIEKVGFAPTMVRWSIYIGWTILLLNFGIFSNHEFIYFQF